MGHVPVATAGDILDAVSQAREAQHRWKRLSFVQRAQILGRFHDLILDRREQILDTIQSETGKARRDAFAELITVAGTARYYLAHGAQHLRAKRHRPAVPIITSAETVYKPLTRPTTMAQWHPRMTELFKSEPIKGPRL